MSGFWADGFWADALWIEDLWIEVEGGPASPEGIVETSVEGEFRADESVGGGF